MNGCVHAHTRHAVQQTKFKFVTVYIVNNGRALLHGKHVTWLDNRTTHNSARIGITDNLLGLEPRSSNGLIKTYAHPLRLTRKKTKRAARHHQFV